MPPQQQWAPPAPPDTPQKEGARWRFHRPSSEAVAEWFGTQPLDEGMEHEHYVGGVVLIPQNEKVKYTKPDGGLFDRYEQVFTPYVQIGTRVAYARRLAEYRGLIYKVEAVQVPRSTSPQSLYFNANMPDGLWWHVVMSEGGNPVRYLCATMAVRFYEPTSYAAKLAGKEASPVLEGIGTKQVGGGPDSNGLMKAQTGAIGRALGVAGILAVGTGIATAEDMQEYQGPPMTAPSPDAAQLPSPTELPEGAPPTPQSDEERLSQLRARALELQARIQENAPDTWRTFVAWWQERKTEAGWDTLDDVPYEALKGIVARMERDLAASTSAAPAQG
jgi:hypothetical protein